MKQITKSEQQLINILLQLPWSIDVIKAANNYYMATISDDPFACSSTGQTEAEAIDNVKQLLREQLVECLRNHEEFEVPFLGDIKLILTPTKKAVQKMRVETVSPDNNAK